MKKAAAVRVDALALPFAVVLAGYFPVEPELSPTTALAASNSKTFPPLSSSSIARPSDGRHPGALLTCPEALATLTL